MNFPRLIEKPKFLRPLYQAYTGEHIPTRIRFDNESSDSRTVIEIETEDRLGLLYSIVEALTALGLDISAAKICTERGAAIDIFYVRELVAGRIEDLKRQQEIARRLEKAIAALDQPSAGRP